MKKHLIFLFSFFFFVTFLLSSQDYVLSGLNAYSRSDWDAAIESFEHAVAAQPSEKKTALYWLIMAHTSARNYHIALDYADLFLETYPYDAGAAEVLYQKGRVAHLYRKYERSTKVLRMFIQKYPDHPKVPSAYYWIAENDFDRRLFPDAREVFQYVVTNYPSSGKINAAQYKIYLIDKITAEQAALKELAEMREKEAPKEPVVEFVAVDSINESDADVCMPEPEDPHDSLSEEQKNDTAYDRIADLERRIEILEAQIIELSDELNRQRERVEEQDKRTQDLTSERKKLQEEMIAEQEKLKRQLAAEQEKLNEKQLEHDIEEREVLLAELKKRREILEKLYDKKQRRLQ